jgi:hypothetical protein
MNRNRELTLARAESRLKAFADVRASILDSKTTIQYLLENQPADDDYYRGRLHSYNVILAGIDARTEVLDELVAELKAGTYDLEELQRLLDAAKGGSDARSDD